MPAPPTDATASWSPNEAATGVALTDAALQLRYVNPAFAALFGGGLRRLVGASLASLAPADERVATLAARALAENRTFRLRGLPTSGATVDVAFSPAHDGVAIEAHPLAPAEREDSPLSASLRGLAHEVKNPLAGVRGAAQLLRRRVDAPELVELTDLIIDEADRLAALADRLLQARAKPRLARLNVHEALERLAALLAAGEHPPRLVRDYDPSLPPVAADADRLHQLVLNLARNAIEAGARTLTLRTRAEHGVRFADRASRTALRLDVVDDGAGVPAELAETLFQPLVSGRANGSGLGLALAQEIAREHGGELRYASRAGDTRFTLMLPVAE